MRHVLSITALCIKMDIPGRRLSSFMLSYNLFGNIPILDGTNDIILAVFSCHILISSSFQVSILLKLFGDGAMKVVT
jgi:hypothetical protein